MTDALQFVGVQGETLIKNPGSINGESFSVRDLTDCTVYLLDYTSEVEVTNCTNSKIFIGPVDGPAILDNCSNCNIAVACQQFQAKGCSACEINLYCATGPTLSGCADISVSCWSGAYAGLTAHFAAANLDPTKNQWNKVYDASASEGGQPPNFTLAEGPVEAWVAEVEGATDAAPDNPVPAPTAATEPAAVPPAAAPAAAPAGSSPLDPFPFENGAAEGSGLADAPPASAAAQDRVQERLASQAREEAEKKASAQTAAGAYLSEFYEKRNAAKDARIAAGRDEMASRGNGESGPSGATVWERAISMIDFNAARPGGSDLGRFKSVLFACKDRTTGAKA